MGLQKEFPLSDLVKYGIKQNPDTAKMRESRLRAFTIDELSAVLDAQPPYEPKYCTFRRDNLTIEIPLGQDEDGNYFDIGYYIDLEECNNQKELMDWIIALLGKQVMCADLLWDVFCTIDLACEEIHGGPIFCVFHEFMEDLDWNKDQT